MPTALEFYCPRWGAEQEPWTDFARRVRDAGYDGVEWGFPRDTDPRELDAAWDACAKHGLPVIAQHFDTADADFDAHRRHYAAWWRLLEGRPLRKVNSQTGRDVFGFRQNGALFDDAAGFAEAYRTTVCHETHRGKWSFAAHVTRDYLERLDREQGRAREQHRAPPPPLGQPPGEERAQGTPQQDGPDSPPKPELVEREVGRDVGDGPGDDGGVEAEQQTRQRRGRTHPRDVGGVERPRRGGRGHGVK